MKKGFSVMLAVLMLGVLYLPGASAATFTMAEEKWNKDGVVSPGFAPPEFDFGNRHWYATFNTPGSHSFILFIDPGIDQATNTSYNEFGWTDGSAPAANQSWEIDEPGYVFGDIFTNFTAGSLDNTNALPNPAREDVSMALGWEFNLAAGETATLEFHLVPTPPHSGFYLVQTDADSDASLYFSSTLDIQGGGPQVPEPGTLILLTAGLLGLFGLRRKVNS